MVSYIICNTKADNSNNYFSSGNKIVLEVSPLSEGYKINNEPDQKHNVASREFEPVSSFKAEEISYNRSLNQNDYAARPIVPSFKREYTHQKPNIGDPALNPGYSSMEGY